MNQIVLNFAPCTPPPSKGYIIKWRIAGSDDIFSYAGNFFTSPAIFYDNVNPAGTDYEGFIQSDCNIMGNQIPWGVDSGCVGGDAAFLATTFVSGNALNDVEVANIFGTPGVTVTVTLDNYVNTNGGKLKVNGSEAYINNTWDVLIGNNCQGHLDVEIDGVINPGTAILGHFTITSVSAGSIGTPDSYQISKAFL